MEPEILIDGDHSHAAALADMHAWAPHVVPGGYCMVDDFHMPDVERAVGEYFGSGLDLVRMPDKNPASVIVLRKQ